MLEFMELANSAATRKAELGLVDTRSGKRLYRKRTVVNVAFTGSIPGIVISTGNAK